MTRRTQADGAGDREVPRRVWAQDVAVTADVLRSRLAARAAALGPDVPPEERAVIDGVRGLLDKAELATRAEEPRPRRVSNWWHGTLIEAAYQHVHAAEAEIVRLYDDAEVDAEVPDAVARVEASLHRDDPRRRAARELPNMPPGPQKRAALLKAIEVGGAAGDRQHTRVRSFRNVVLMTTFLLLVVVGGVLLLARVNPASLSLCFTPEEAAGGGQVTTVCPAGGESPQAWDAAVVALMGALGGVLAAAVSIRTMRGTSTPYAVPVALSLLKVPAGALTALAALIAIRGQFVPGLSDLDTHEQILAYALVFGYAQQLFTRLVDARAGDVLNSVVSKDAAVERPELRDWPPRQPRADAPSANGSPPPSDGGGRIPVQTTRDDALDRAAQEADVLDLLDTRPVPLSEGQLGEGYDVLRAEHFGTDEPHDEHDQLDEVELLDAEDEVTERLADRPSDAGTALAGGDDTGSRRI